VVAKDGRQIAAEVGPELDYLSRVSRKLGVVDLVHDFFDPLVGDWNDLREESERWRKAAKVTEAVNKHVAAPLGGVDARWQGRDADAFRSDWAGSYRTQLVAVSTALREASTRATANAGQQEEASRA